jgi:hypothetical protein
MPPSSPAKRLSPDGFCGCPIIAWIYETLQHDDNHRVAWDYFHEKLQADFGDRAEEQLDIAIRWGRDAELFAYDDDTAELYLRAMPAKAPREALLSPSFTKHGPCSPCRNESKDSGCSSRMTQRISFST